MAFFNQIGKKITQAGQSAVQKTKDITEIAKINNAISDEEKKLNNAYIEIGKLYVERYADAADAAFATMVLTVKETESNIRAYREQIQDIKGIMRCERCGAEIATNAAFCSACGAQVVREESPLKEDEIHCTGCGAVIEKNLKFCTACGKPTGQAEDIDDAVPEQAEQARICPNCKQQVEDGCLFCTKCGTKL